ncbi:hypothetical protein D3C73_934320 [compost metagenome]
MCLVVSFLLQLGIVRVSQRCSRQRRRHHASAHDIERRVHPGNNTVIPHLRSTGQQLLEALRHSIGQRKSSQIRSIGMSARESAVRCRRSADCRDQGRDDDRGIAPTERTHITVEIFCRCCRSIVAADKPDQVNHFSKLGIRVSAFICSIAVSVLHRSSISGNAGDCSVRSRFLAVNLRE